MPNAKTFKAPHGRGRGKIISPRKKAQTITVALSLKKRATAKPAQQPVDSPQDDDLNMNSPISVGHFSEEGHVVIPSRDSETEMYSTWQQAVSWTILSHQEKADELGYTGMYKLTCHYPFSGVC